MFGFMRASKKTKSEAELAEDKLLESLKKALGDESPTTTNLKNRLRIIDLEDKVIKLEKQIKKIRSLMSVRAYRLNKKVIVKKKVK